MAPVAGEVVSELSVAMAAGLPFDKLAVVMHSYPAYSMALQIMAAEVYYAKTKKSQGLYRVLKRLGF